MAITVKVSTAQMEAAANRVDADREATLRLLRDIIDSPVFNYWQGEASNAYRKKLEGLQSDINKVDRIFKEMINDLRRIGRVYIKAENDVATKAASLSPNSLTF